MEYGTHFEINSAGILPKFTGIWISDDLYTAEYGIPELKLLDPLNTVVCISNFKHSKCTIFKYKGQRARFTQKKGDPRTCFGVYTFIGSTAYCSTGLYFYMSIDNVVMVYVLIEELLD